MLLRNLFYFVLLVNIFWAFELSAQHSASKYQSPDRSFYKTYSRSSQYVPLSDSIKIALDVYLPEKGPKKDNYPVVFVMTPYGRAYIAPNIGVHLRFLTWVMGAGWQPIIDQHRYSPSVKKLLENGYAVVVADMRGTGVSYGAQMPLDPQLGKDGKELIEWIVKQPFSNGDVGMMGLSYLGWAQYITAAQHPAALRCIAPEVIFFESYSSSFRPGGILATRWLESFSERLSLMNMNFAQLNKFYLPAVPVYDEDGDGRLEDEWPQIDSTIFLTESLPRYKDHDRRTEHFYWNATREHRLNLRVADLMLPDYCYFNSYTPEQYAGFTYKDVAPGYYLPKVHELNIPILSIGRWHDGFIKGTTMLHASSQHIENQHLLINPGFHIPLYSKSNRKFIGYEDDPSEVVSTQHLMFFDKYLKKLDNDYDKKKSVEFFVPNKGWRTENQWPPLAVSNQSFYVSDGKIGKELPLAAVDTLRLDSLHRSDFGKKNYNRWTMASGAPRKPMERTKIDNHASVFDGEPLTSDVEIIGHPIIELWISANCSDADLFVYLEEVDERGRAWYVTEGQLRATWHKESSLQQQMGINLEIKPELPWHGYTIDFESKAPLGTSEPILMRFDLQPIAWNFKKGHRIRVSIAGMDAVNFEINEAYAEKNRLSEVEIYLHQGTLQPSRIILPIMEVD
jgi:uncharacterized protein